MPLDRAHWTVAERITLRLYPAMAIAYGLVLLLTPMPMLLRTPAFQVADDVMDLRVWGCIFVGVGILQATALLAQRHLTNAYSYALALLMVLMAIWAGISAVGAARGQVTWAATILYLFVMFAAWASMTQLLAKRV